MSINFFQKKIFSVSEITLILKEIIEGAFPYPVYIEGEIFDLSISISGHIYFSLKDSQSTIRAVMFRSSTKILKFKPQNGMKVICYGNIRVYTEKGLYQFYVEDMRISGKGELLILFENLKKKLAEEGLFDEKRKRKLPFIPKTIGVVTSPKGAAIRDIIKAIHKRFPAKILLCPALVQGEGAPAEIISAISALNEIKDVDVIIVGRGGGSFEDLWAFNDEGVVRAIFNSKKPVISAVGHEIDYVLSDFVADVRAPTPTAAGEIVVPSLDELFEKISDGKQKIFLGLKRITERKIQSYDEISRRFESRIKNLLDKKRSELEKMEKILPLLNPIQKLKKTEEEIHNINMRFTNLIGAIFSEKKKKIELFSEKLSALNPLSILERGYSIAFKMPEREIIKDSNFVNTGDEVEIVLHKGKLNCEVINKEV